MPSEMYEPRAVRIQRRRCHLQLKTSRKDARRLRLEGWPEFECWIWGNGEERAFWTQGTMWAETWRQAQKGTGNEAGGGKGFECQAKECGLNLGNTHGCSGAEAGSSDLSCWELILEAPGALTLCSTSCPFPRAVLVSTDPSSFSSAQTELEFSSRNASSGGKWKCKVWLRSNPADFHALQHPVKSGVCNSRQTCVWIPPLSLRISHITSLSLHFFFCKMEWAGTSLVVQWLRIHLPVQGTWARSLIWEGSTCCGVTEPACHSYRACVSEPLLCSKRHHRNEKPTHCN